MNQFKSPSVILAIATITVSLFIIGYAGRTSNHTNTTSDSTLFDDVPGSVKLRGETKYSIKVGNRTETMSTFTDPVYGCQYFIDRSGRLHERVGSGCFSNTDGSPTTQQPEPLTAEQIAINHQLTFEFEAEIEEGERKLARNRELLDSKRAILECMQASRHTGTYRDCKRD